MFSLHTPLASQHFPFPMFLILRFIFTLVFIIIIFIVVQVQLCLISPPLHPQCPAYPYLLPSILPPLALSMCLLYMFLDGPSPIFPHYPSPLSPLVTVTLFFISMSLVIFCLLICFVDWVPLTGEIIRYLSFTTWLFSLSITLSRAIHAVAKGRNFIFLSAA